MTVEINDLKHLDKRDQVDQERRGRAGGGAGGESLTRDARFRIPNANPDGVCILNLAS